jgi:glycosyltransferase involved in cell wall biosynthesis
LRILYLSPYPPARDGIGTYTAAFAGAMDARGHEVRVVAARPDPDSPPEVIAALPLHNRDRAALVARVRLWAPDVVHVQFAVAAYAARLPALLRLVAALRAAGLPVVMTMHEVTRDTESLRAPGRALYRRAAALADHVVVHTGNALDELRGPVGATAAAAAVIPHPRTELPPAVRSAAQLRATHGLGGDRVLLAFGFIDVDKGLDDLVRAFALLPDRAGVRLAVAGAVRARHGVFRVFELRDRLHLRRVRALVAKLGVEGSVTFAGYVPGGDVRGWFELAAAAVLPYRRIEQSGVANLAASAGTPVLASTAGELGALRTFPPRDPVALAGVLHSFLRAPAPQPDPEATGSDLPAIVDRTLDLYAIKEPAHA